MISALKGGCAVKQRLRRIGDDWAIPAAILLVMLTAAMLTGQWPWTGNMYHSYTLQACSWLQGRLDLGQDYPWLELAIHEGRYYVSFPPFPSYVMLPFAAVFGTETPDGWIALAVTLLGICYAMRLYRALGGPERQMAFWVLFLYLGTGYLFISLNGWVWFIAQTMCFTLMLIALYASLKGHGGTALTCWACAVGCRPMTALYFPLLAYVLLRKLHSDRPELTIPQLILRHLHWAIGPLLLAASYMTLNWLRFGDPLEFGHNYLPEFTRTPTGQFSLTYLAENLTNLLRLPYVEDGRLVFYKINGNAFWLTNPLILIAAAAWCAALIRRRTSPVLLVMIPLLTAAYVFILCCHRTMGGWQFGCRYLLDVMPVLFFGLVLWMPRGDRFRRWCMPLLAFSAALNVVGTVLLYNKWM